MRDEKLIQLIVKFNKQQNEKQKQTINMYCVCPKRFFIYLPLTGMHKPKNLKSNP